MTYLSIRSAFSGVESILETFEKNQGCQHFHHLLAKTLDQKEMMPSYVSNKEQYAEEWGRLMVVSIGTWEVYEAQAFTELASRARSFFFELSRGAGREQNIKKYINMGLGCAFGFAEVVSQIAALAYFKLAIYDQPNFCEIKVYVDAGYPIYDANSMQLAATALLISYTIQTVTQDYYMLRAAERIAGCALLIITLSMSEHFIALKKYKGE